MHAQNHFFLVVLKFNLASVKNNKNYDKKYFECVFGCRVGNITSHATTLGTTVQTIAAYQKAIPKLDDYMHCV